MFIFANNRQTKQTMRKDVAVLMVLWVMCIPYATFICASATPNKLDTLKAFLRKKNTLRWIRTGRQRHLLERKHPADYQDKQSEWRKLLFAAIATCQCLYITRRHQPRHRPGTTNVRRSQRNGIWVRNCSCQPSHRRCLHHSQSMRQSIGFVPRCFKGIKPSLAATSLPDTTLIKDIQCFTT